MNGGLPGVRHVEDGTGWSAQVFGSRFLWPPAYEIVDVLILPGRGFLDALGKQTDLPVEIGFSWKLWCPCPALEDGFANITEDFEVILPH